MMCQRCGSGGRPSSRLAVCRQKLTALTGYARPAHAQVTFLSGCETGTPRSQQSYSVRTRRGGSRRISPSCRSWCARLDARVSLYSGDRSDFRQTKVAPVDTLVVSNRVSVGGLPSLSVRQPHVGGHVWGTKAKPLAQHLPVLADGFAYLKHCRLCPPAAFRRLGPPRNNPPVSSSATGLALILHYVPQ